MYSFHDKKNRGNKLIHVLSIVYNVNIQKSYTTVNFSGVVWKFNPDSKKDQWSRKNSVKWAKERLSTCPITVHFDIEKHSPGYYQYRRLERYMRNYIYEFGLSKADIHCCDNTIFESKLTSNEEELQAIYEESLRIYTTPKDTPPKQISHVPKTWWKNWFTW